MKIFDISGNEITGKEVVFERYVTMYDNFEAMMRPAAFKHVIHIGSTEQFEVFMAYPKDGSVKAFLYLGQLKDKE